ncbi:MAG: hypothetical protein AAF551_14150, partial [Bacteroidota bacterium]
YETLFNEFLIASGNLLTTDLSGVAPWNFPAMPATRYHDFLDGLLAYVKEKAVDNRVCLAALNDNAIPYTDQQVIDCICRASEDELKEADLLKIRGRKRAISAIISSSTGDNLDNNREKAVVRLFKYFPESLDSDELLDHLQVARVGEVAYWKKLFDRVDDSKWLVTGDNRKELVQAFLKHYYRSDLFVSQVKGILGDLGEKTIKDVSELSDTYAYDYQTVIKRILNTGAFASPDKFYVTLNTAVNLPGTEISISQRISSGLLLSAELRTKTYYPFDLIFFINLSKQKLLNPFKNLSTIEQLGSKPPVPALLAHYASTVGDNETTEDVIMLSLDAASLLIPASQFTKIARIGKFFFYADRVSSLASLGENAVRYDDPKLAQILKGTSAIAGVASMGDLLINKATKANIIMRALDKTPEEAATNLLNTAQAINAVDPTKLKNLDERQTGGHSSFDAR